MMTREQVIDVMMSMAATPVDPLNFGRCLLCMKAGCTFSVDTTPKYSNILTISSHTELLQFFLKKTQPIDESRQRLLERIDAAIVPYEKWYTSHYNYEYQLQLGVLLGHILCGREYTYDPQTNVVVYDGGRQLKLPDSKE